MRAKYLDYAKAVGIFLVIAEHVIASYAFMQPATVCILAFHMPLFFVISGYQYSLKKKIGGITWGFVGKRARRLLIPYAVFAACILCYKVPSALIAEHRLSPAFLKYMAENIFVTGYGVGWFLIALFYAELLFKAAFCSEKKSVHAAAAVASCLLGIGFSFGGNVFFKLAARVLIACAFLWAGYYAGRLKLLDRLPGYACVGVFALSVVLCEFNGQCSMLNVSFGISILLFLYNAAAMSLAFLGIMKRLETKKWPFLGIIGCHTLIILLTHTYIISAIKRVFRLLLPHIPAGDAASILLQLIGTCLLETALVWTICKIGRNRTRNGGRLAQ